MIRVAGLGRLKPSKKNSQKKPDRKLRIRLEVAARKLVRFVRAHLYDENFTRTNYENGAMPIMQWILAGSQHIAEEEVMEILNHQEVANRLFHTICALDLNRDFPAIKEWEGIIKECIQKDIATS
jgi:hypothetical protein